MFDLRHLIYEVETTVANHNLGWPGAYRRWNGPDPHRTENRDLSINPYGCADAANILYTICRFPAETQQKQAWIFTLQGLQDQQTGMFVEPTHHPIHTTAHCTAALELFDARPLHPFVELTRLHRTHELSAFLDELNWRGDPWSESHRGAGVFAALVLKREVSLDWEERYFAWLWDEADPATGLFRKGHIGPVTAYHTTSIFPHLAGTFHYLFNLEYAHRPLRYPEKLVDTCLELYHARAYPLGERIGFAEIDWVFCLNRAVRQSGHRFGDSRRALYEFAKKYIDFLHSIDGENDDDFNDLHLLFGVLCCLAELQQALPGEIRTVHPLRLVLDRRPFI